MYKDVPNSAHVLKKLVLHLSQISPLFPRNLVQLLIARLGVLPTSTQRGDLESSLHRQAANLSAHKAVSAQHQQATPTVGVGLLQIKMSRKCAEKRNQMKLGRTKEFMSMQALSCVHKCG